ncbi:peptidase M16 [Marmoricola sp. Leaf446]|uniref:M57 family metalloprotease n=1 Tax=Marmoricola sp. Leaf446 TaxID=1736379 RepID=UPI0006F3F8C8|nr:M57 family metalloprotease [Marmoricola sp. Leaf446]KQT89501.1 peptidase M16 [Marmoricola sp. Leaf446]
MKRSRPAQLAVAAASVVTAGLALAPVTSASADVAKDGSEVPTFAEFKAATYQESSRQYVVNGDVPVRDTKLLKEYYDHMVATDDEASGNAGLVVNTVYGSDDLWSSTAARNLTYCVSNSFGTQKAAIVSAMDQGTALWENQTSGVDFTYVSSHDASCRTSNTSVVFSVEPTTTTQYIARAFFPSSPKSQRNVLVNAGSLQNSGSWTPGNIMGHELGHVLGFRHEHTRPEAGTCFEDTNWRPLTPYDNVSIMHYPQCNGGSSNLSFSAYDGSGVRSVYGG